MSYLLATVLIGSSLLTQPNQPPAPPAPAAQNERVPAEDVPLVEAAKEETWTLGEQQWNFKDIATAYQPVKGTYNAKTGVAEWTLELVKELSAGEIAILGSAEGSPFKIVLFDEEQLALDDEPTLKLSSRLTGKPGDKVKVAVQLPMADTLGKVRLVRVERRTKIGF
jgi:hypothetical protein